MLETNVLLVLMKSAIVINFKTKLGVLLLVLLVASGLSACGSSSDDVTGPSDSSNDGTDPATVTMDFTGAWRTSCLSVNATQARSVFLELLDDGQYRMESSNFDGQDCGSTDNQIFFETESGIFTVGEQVDVPSGVVATGVLFTVEMRETNGESVDISDDQGFLDILPRDGNTLIRAQLNPVGTAGVQQSEQLDFSVVYFLE